MKNKHAAKKSGVSNSKANARPVNDGIVRKKRKVGGAPAVSSVKGRPGLVDALLKRKKRTYSEKDLKIPQLNMVTPMGVIKPPGKKKGKEFVDDRVILLSQFLISVGLESREVANYIMKYRRAWRPLCQSYKLRRKAILNPRL